MEKNSKIYVAGHTGLVGSAILRKLKELGYENVIGKTIDELNLSDQKSVADFYSEIKPDYVFLAAAKVGGIIANNTFRAQFIYENLQIQNNVIHQSFLHHIKKLLFLGTSCIYPKNCPVPIKESDLLTGELEYTNEPYAIAKIAGLKMCESYNIQYGTNFLSVMPTNLYGPNDNYDLEYSHVLPAIVRKLHLAKCIETRDWDSLRVDLNKRPVGKTSGNSPLKNIISILSQYGLTIDPAVYSAFYDSVKDTLVNYPENHLLPVTVTLWGSGRPRREFLHVDDMADAAIFIMNKIDFPDLVNRAETKDQPKNLHLNIGYGRDFTIKEISGIIKEIVGFRGEIIFDNSHPDGTYQKLLSTEKLSSLGWIPSISLERGIKDTYQHYKK